MALSTAVPRTLRKDSAGAHKVRPADIISRDTISVKRLRAPTRLHEPSQHNHLSDPHAHQHKMAVHAVDVLSHHLHPVLAHGPGCPEVQRVVVELQSLNRLAEDENFKWAAAVGLEMDSGLKQHKVHLDSARRKNECAKAALANLRHLLNDANTIMHENKTAQFAEEVYICGRRHNAQAQREHRAFHLSSVLQQLDIERRLTKMYNAVVDIMAQLESLSALTPLSSPQQLGSSMPATKNQQCLPPDTAVPPATAVPRIPAVPLPATAARATPAPVHVIPAVPFPVGVPLLDGLVASNVLPLSGLTPLPFVPATGTVPATPPGVKVAS